MNGGGGKKKKGGSRSSFLLRCVCWNRRSWRTHVSDDGPGRSRGTSHAMRGADRSLVRVFLSLTPRRMVRSMSCPWASSGSGPVRVLLVPLGLGRGQRRVGGGPADPGRRGLPGREALRAGGLLALLHPASQPAGEAARELGNGGGLNRDDGRPDGDGPPRPSTHGGLGGGRAADGGHARGDHGRPCRGRDSRRGGGPLGLEHLAVRLADVAVARDGGRLVEVLLVHLGVRAY